MEINKHLTRKLFIIGVLVCCWIIGAVRYIAQILSR